MSDKAFSNTPAAVEAVLTKATERGLRDVQFCLFDSYGHMMAKRANVANLRKALTEGTNMVAAILAAAPSGTDLIESNPHADPADGFRDGVLLMDAESCRDFPLEADGDGLLLIGEFTDSTREYCVRARLREELARLRSLGYLAYGAFELESVPLKESLDTLRRKSVNALAYHTGYERPYQMVPGQEDRDYLDELNAACAGMDIELDAQHAEFKFLIETSLRPQLGLRIADNAALFKNVAKLLARQRGFLMSFMARWHHRHQGCGAHINVSLKHAESGDSAFFDAGAPDNLSPQVRHFVAGLHAYLPELFLLIAPNLNSYKRFLPGLFTPLNNTWGVNNKTVANRVINQSPGTARVEMRLAGADVSPHLGLLAVVMAGRRGLEERLEPPAPVTGNGWDAAAGEPAFPTTFAGAIETFERSRLARDTLGDAFVDGYVGDRRWQIGAFERAVTDWELQMFADGA